MDENAELNQQIKNLEEVISNEQNQKEIIDGQQRLTTLLLLLRAFYERYGNMKNERAIKTGEKIAACIWKTNEFGDPDKTALKITSEVATDNEKEEFLTILKTGDAKDKKSRYHLRSNK